MSIFAGDNPRRIHHLERDAEFLIEFAERDIVASRGRTGGSDS
jgi:hypothetical protein